jgi:hypothetical protein
MYFIITDETGNFEEHRYHDGLNILNQCFTKGKHSFGSLFFTDVKHILKYLNSAGKKSVYLREIMLPINDPDFKIVCHSSGEKWKANKIIVGKKYSLSNTKTFEYLVSSGTDIHINKDHPLCWAALEGHYDIVKYIIELDKRTVMRSDYEDALICASMYGHSEIVKLLIENGADVNANNSGPIIYASEKGQLLIVKYLVDHGANFCGDNNFPLLMAFLNCHTDVVKYLVEHGASIQSRASDDYVVEHAHKIKNSPIVQFLIEKNQLNEISS